MTERILTPEEYAKLMDDCVDDCIAANKTHLPLFAHDKLLRVVNEEMKEYIDELNQQNLNLVNEIKMWQKEINRLEDEKHNLKLELVNAKVEALHARVAVLEAKKYPKPGSAYDLPALAKHLSRERS